LGGGEKKNLVNDKAKGKRGKGWKEKGSIPGKNHDATKNSRFASQHAPNTHGMVDTVWGKIWV